MATNDLWRASLVGDWSGTNLAVCTFHFKMISPAGTPAGLAASVKTNIATVLKSDQHSSFYWRSVNLLSINLVPQQSLVYTTGFPLQGYLSTGDSLPFSDAMVTTLRTAYAGRSYRGRFYLPAIPETYCSGSTIDGTYLSGFQTLMDTMVALYGAGGSDPDYQLGVYSGKLASFNPVTSMVVRAVIATQRRRRPGYGA